MAGSPAAGQTRPQDLQCLIREATLILQEPVETMASPLRTYRKRIQVQQEVLWLLFFLFKLHLNIRIFIDLPRPFLFPSMLH